MSYQIDQSGKIEQTAKHTYVALANGKTIIIKISATEKRKVIDVIKELQLPHKTYVYQIFASLVFLLIKDEKLHEVLIDTEYYGHHASIKESLMQLFQRFEKSPPVVHFGFVGKESPAHLAAIQAFREQRKVTITVKAENVLTLLYSKRNVSTKKGWRPRSGRGNP